MTYLRADAHKLLEGVREGLPEAMARLEKSGSGPKRNYSLHDALRVVAKEYGFRSWQSLDQFVAWLRTEEAQLEREWLERAMSGRVTDAASPSLAVACALGDNLAVKGFLEPKPSLVNQPCGGLARVPLVYACFSQASTEEGARETVRVLLEIGANPNSIQWADHGPEWPLSVLYGACGVRRDPVLAEILLNAGAEINDNESLYHSCESSDHSCLKLLLDRGAMIDGTAALLRILDREDPEGLALLLSHPCSLDAEPSPIVHAILNGRSPAIIRQLVAAGAKPSDEAYAVAVRFGEPELALVLQELGATDDAVTPTDRFLGACSRGNAEDARAVLSDSPDLWESLGEEDFAHLAEMAWRGRVNAVRAMLDLRFPVDAKDGQGATALHRAAWKGSVSCLEALLAAGASVSHVEPVYGVTALGWALHGSEFCDQPLGSHADCVRLLLEAGSEKPEKPQGSKEVREVLSQYGIL